MLKKLFSPKAIKLSKSSSPALQKFDQSMNIGYMEWHEGIGYDLKALSELSDGELSQVETLFISRKVRDWRDVEVLAEIGSEQALSALKNALKSRYYEVRIRAAEKLSQKGAISEEEIETLLVETIPLVSILNGQTFTLRLVENYPTPAVKRILLWCTLYGKDDIRVHAAALIYYFYGFATSSFDWNYRSFYLRFGDKNLSNRKLAYDELCDKIQVDPKWAIDKSA
jgi:hypothetical protein